MRIEMWPIDRLKPYPKNARKWTQKAVEKVAESIRSYGWRQPIVVDVDDIIVIGDEHFIVPLRFLVDAIIREPQPADLRRRQVARDVHRHFRQLQVLRCRVAKVARNCST